MVKQLPIEIFMPPNVLKAKACCENGSSHDAAILRAELALQTLKIEFDDWVGSDVHHLVEWRDRFARQPDQATRDGLIRAAHHLKGQATSFEYPMISRMTTSLTKLFEGTIHSEPALLDLVDAHVAAIRAVFHNKIKSVSDHNSIVTAKELEARVDEVL